MKKSCLVIMSIFFFVNAHAQEVVQTSWECYAADQGGHFWKSTGMTQERALAVAMSFCGAYSPNGKTCQMSKCLEK